MDIIDRFRSNNASLLASIAALLRIDERGCLAPHGLGGFAKDLLSASHVRLGIATAERDALQQLLNARDEEVDRLRAALKFYADKEHFYLGDDNWDTVSGEPANILWHAEEPYSVEDGWLARQALENQA